jgi:hypothetical protein
MPDIDLVAVIMNSSNQSGFVTTNIELKPAQAGWVKESA